MCSANRNVRRSSFKDLFAALPEWVKDQAQQAYDVFRRDPDHPSLRRHQLRNPGERVEPGTFSISITMKYRALYFIDGGTNVWYWIGTHNDYDTYIA
ncbi:MAG: hypothetical protein U0800_08570 [Isosphaeraceae bacterium]